MLMPAIAEAAEKDVVRTGTMHPFKERPSALAMCLPESVGSGTACLFA